MKELIKIVGVLNLLIGLCTPNDSPLLTLIFFTGGAILLFVAHKENECGACGWCGKKMPNIIPGSTGICSECKEQSLAAYYREQL